LPRHRADRPEHRHDLEQAGYLRRERAGRRTRYILCLDGTLRHPADAHVPVRALLELFTHHDSKR
jgi:hypothetical protein